MRHYFMRPAVDWAVFICLLALLVQPLASQRQASTDSRADQSETTATGTVPPEPTGKHKLNSTLYSAKGRGGSLLGRAKKEKSIDILVGAPMPFFPDGATKGHSLAEFVHEHVCSSDAVVIGHVIGKESYLTENNDWVFTDYDFMVDEVFKSPGPQIEQGKQITVTRTGGELIIYGHPVKATESLYRPFQLRDRYVLFLKFLPASQSYQAVKPGSSYRVDSGKIRKLTDGGLIPELDQPFDWQSFQNQIRIAAASGCDSGKGGPK